MKILHSTKRLLLLSLAMPILIACEGDGVLDTSLDPPPPLLPAPMIEATRPMANTNLTYFRFIEMDAAEKDRWVAMAEDSLVEVLAAGVEMQSAWITRYPRDWGFGAVGTVITVRLAEPDRAIIDHGFVDDPILPWINEPTLETETRHYRFRSAPELHVPERFLELGGLVDDTDLIYHHFLTEDNPPGDAVFEGVDKFLATLVAEGVDVRHAWVHHVNTFNWSRFSLAVEVGSPHPILERSDLRETPATGNKFGGPVWWHTCFGHDECPRDIPLPEPEVAWQAPLFPGRAVYYRSIPSCEYDDVVCDRKGAERELQRLARGGIDVVRAWIPTGRSACEYTNIVIELAQDDPLVGAWGYEPQPTGDPPEYPWCHVYRYELDPEERDESSKGQRLRPRSFATP